MESTEQLSTALTAPRSKNVRLKTWPLKSSAPLENEDRTSEKFRSSEKHRTEKLRISDKFRISEEQSPRTAHLVERIKEVFQRFDRDKSGVLEYGEMMRVLKCLFGTIEQDRLMQYCIEIDKNQNGAISFQEFLHWMLHGPEARRYQNFLKIQTGETREAKIRKVFLQYDTSGDGNLEIPELQTVLKSLGAFTNDEVSRVCKDLDTSGDGEVSFQEFADWIKCGHGSQLMTKAKAILVPGDDDGLESVFYMFCSPGRSDIDGKSFIKMCRDAKLIDKKLTERELDIIFIKCLAKHDRRMGFERFENMLEHVAETKGASLTDVRNALLQVCGPKLLGTKAVGRVRPTSAPSTPRGPKTPTGTLSSAEPRSPKSPKSAFSTPWSQVKEPLQTVDNKDLWKTFGIDLPVGRRLKNLYGGGKLEPVRKRARPLVTTWPPQEDAYMVVNGLQSGSAGLQFRRSMNIFDISKGAREFIPWGEIVQGTRVDACWLKVGDRFLPTTINNVPLLRLKKRFLMGEVFHASMPDLHGKVKEHSTPSLLMLGRTASA